MLTVALSAALLALGGYPRPAYAGPEPNAEYQAVPAAGSGVIIGGAIPVGGGIGLIVFGGGTSNQLLTASGCAAATAAFYTTNAVGDFVAYVPGTAVTVVNAEWNLRFANGIPANTAILGRCR